jgi:CMP-N-acetylneuraminic acid synthetase
MKAFAFIFARGGSKGLPGKNTRQLGGKPLIAHSIQLALSIDCINQVFVSTEDHTISDISSDYGAVVIPRPLELASDDAPEWAAWIHAVEWVSHNIGPFEQFVSLPATSPLRKDVDVINCMHALTDDVDVVVAISPSARNPWFNMVAENGEGYLTTVIGSNSQINRRQDCPEVYDLTTIAYVTRPSFIRSAVGIFDGRVRGVKVAKECAIDIDDAFDFKLAEFLFLNNRTNLIGQ